LLAALHSRKSQELLILLSKGFFSFFFGVSTFVLLLHSNSVGPKGSQNTASDLDSFLVLSPGWLFTSKFTTIIKLLFTILSTFFAADSLFSDLLRGAFQIATWFDGIYHE